MRNYHCISDSVAYDNSVQLQCQRVLALLEMENSWMWGLYNIFTLKHERNSRVSSCDIATIDYNANKAEPTSQRSNHGIRLVTVASNNGLANVSLEMDAVCFRATRFSDAFTWALERHAYAYCWFPWLFLLIWLGHDQQTTIFLKQNVATQLQGKCIEVCILSPGL